jgi:glycosyltransferase involved in cell wall biosynthesis
MLLSGKTLYLCYFWLDTPLVQTQVLPYLREIALGGAKVYLLTFEREKFSAEQIEEKRKSLAGEGIEWHFLTYHKRPSAPATFFDVLCGAWFAWKLTRKENINVLHGRLHIGAMMGVIAKKLLSRNVKVLFDIRSFFPEEYTDAGIWKANGWLYKLVKTAERSILKNSDGFIVLTEKGREILFPESKESGFDKLGRPVEVIPCCADFSRFESANNKTRQEMRAKLNVEKRFVVGYVGSFGGWYLTEEMADFWQVAKQKNVDTFALILTQSDPQMIQPLLEARGFTEKDFFIKKVAVEDIPVYFSVADVAISFIKPCYSKLSSSPTKNAEYLACGVPMIANGGVGDTKELTLDDNVGVIIDEFNHESYEKAFDEVNELQKNKEELAERCKSSAIKRFDLKTVGGERYRRIYQKLLN